MKEQDLMYALSNLPQDLLDELEAWQKSGTPLTGAEPEDKAPARTEKPVIKRRRGPQMKQNKVKAPTRLRAWTAGIAAAIVICAAVAVPVGKEAIRRAGNTGNSAQSAGTAVLHDPVPLGDGGNYYAGSDRTDIAVPAEGAVQVLRCMEDMQPLMSFMEQRKYLSSIQYPSHKQLNEQTFEASDVLYFAFKDKQIPCNSYSCEFTGGNIESDGSLTLYFSALILDDQPAGHEAYTVRAENLYYFFEVPKNALPDISKISLVITETGIGELPADVKSNWNQIIPQDPSELRIIDVLTDYVENSQKYQDWKKSIPEQLYITWNGVQQDADTQAAELPDDDDRTPENAFYAWYQTSYCGNDIPLAHQTAAVIRTAEDGKPYLTCSGQQDRTDLATILSETWLETGADAAEELTDPVSGTRISHDGKPHDVIFIGIPSLNLPRNTVRTVYHNGTLTESGMLHLDFSHLTVSDEIMALLPENERHDETQNRYIFISVPAGELPEFTGITLSFTEYHTEAVPSEAMDSASDSAWLDRFPATQNWWASVLGGKYIYRIPSEQPDTAAVLGAYTCTADAPSAAQQNNDPSAAVMPSGSGYDELRLELPVHDASAITALSDIRITAEGVLSLTLNECYNAHNIDEAQDTAYVTWKLNVQPDSLPQITAVDLNRNLLYDETEFMQIAGQMMTITK